MPITTTPFKIPYELPDHNDGVFAAIYLKRPGGNNDIYLSMEDLDQLLERRHLVRQPLTQNALAPWETFQDNGKLYLNVSVVLYTLPMVRETADLRELFTKIIRDAAKIVASTK